MVCEPHSLYCDKYEYTEYARLFQEVREKRGLAYSVYSYLSQYNECGSQTIYAGVNPSQLTQAYDAIMSVVKDVKQNGITLDEFNRSREQMKASMFFSNESTNSQMLLYGKYMLNNGKVFDFDEKLAKINGMTYEQTRVALENMFDENKMSVALVGNTDKPLPLT